MFRRLEAMLEGISRTVAVTYIIAIVVAIVAYKWIFVGVIRLDPFFGIYGITVTGYILSRFLLSLMHRSRRGTYIEPAVTVVIPALNEEDAIADTINAVLDQRYPRERISVVVVNDGSTDNTLARMNQVAATDPRVEVIDFPVNRGKRAAMAAGLRATDEEIVCFVDSDSMLDGHALRRGVQAFRDRRVGAVAGHADVLNVGESWLTRMQAVRYFVAFRVLKAAESLFGAVTCCSGCFALYRRSAIVPHLKDWEEQTFFGHKATFGDDRSLTNFVLRDHRVVYEARAVSRTIVPSTMRQFLRQQLRWKRSWTRESLIVGSFIWRKHPIAAAGTYVGILLPLVAPLAVVRALVIKPAIGGTTPVIYLIGIYVMAVIYGLYFGLQRGMTDGLWLFGIAFVFFYLAVLVWQTYYAIPTSWRSDWGTRSGRARSPAVQGVGEA